MNAIRMIASNCVMVYNFLVICVGEVVVQPLHFISICFLTRMHMHSANMNWHEEHPKQEVKFGIPTRDLNLIEVNNGCASYRRLIK